MKFSKKQIAAFVLTPIIILSLVFFWNEINDLSLSKKINHDKIADYFTTLFTFFGTIAAIYFGYNQNKLSEDLNIATIRPYLAPERSTFKMKDFPLPNVDSKTLYIAIPESISEHSPVGLKIKNKGVGAAKDIHLEWKFDNKQVEKIVEGIYLPRDINLLSIPEIIQAGDTDYLPLPNDYLCCCGSRVNEGHFIITNIPFLPQNIERKLGGELPESYNKFSGNIKPSLLLIITYRDMHDRNYSKQYEVILTNFTNYFTFNFKPKLAG